MTLTEYVNSLDDRKIKPKRDFIRLLRRLTGKTEASVYRWLNGEVIPDKSDRGIISDAAGIPVEELWPALKEENNTLNIQS
jgi:hypothetical protein